MCPRAAGRVQVPGPPLSPVRVSFLCSCCEGGQWGCGENSSWRLLSPTQSLKWGGDWRVNEISPHSLSGLTQRASQLSEGSRGPDSDRLAAQAEKACATSAEKKTKAILWARCGCCESFSILLWNSILCVFVGQRLMVSFITVKGLAQGMRSLGRRFLRSWKTGFQNHFRGFRAP